MDSENEPKVKPKQNRHVTWLNNIETIIDRSHPPSVVISSESNNSEQKNQATKIDKPKRSEVKSSEPKNPAPKNGELKSPDEKAPERLSAKSAEPTVPSTTNKADLSENPKSQTQSSSDVKPDVGGIETKLGQAELDTKSTREVKPAAETEVKTKPKDKTGKSPNSVSNVQQKDLPMPPNKT